MKLKVFTKEACPNCPPAKRLAETIEDEGKMKVEYFSVDDPDGLAEAQFYSVMATPTLVLAYETDKEVASWRGAAPEKKEVYDKML